MNLVSIREGRISQVREGRIVEEEGREGQMRPQGFGKRADSRLVVATTIERFRLALVEPRHAQTRKHKQ